MMIMELTLKVLLVLICEVIISSEQKIIKNISELENPTSKLQDVLVKILKDCNEDYNTLLVFTDSEVINLTWMQELQTDISIILYQNLSQKFPENTLMKRIDAYLLIVSSITSVKDIFWFLRDNIPWWDVLVPVYMLNPETCGCTNSNSGLEKTNFLELVFRYLNRVGVVTIYVVCFDFQRGVKLYTSNMFTDQAPSRWKRVDKMFEKYHWTMYERDFFEDDICKEFDFDRTNQPGGFELIIASSPEFVDPSLIGDLYDQSIIYDSPEYLDRYQRLYIDALSTALNVRCSIYFNAPRSRDKMQWYEWPNYILNVWINSSCDIFLAPEIISQDISIYTFKNSYPQPLTEFGIITHHRGYETFAEKIEDFYGVWIISFTSFILLVVFIVIWFTANKKTFFTVAEIIRLLIGQSLLTPMNMLSLRIFFSMILIYFLVMQATFNGHLAEFLTKPRLRKHADTLEDLKSLGYTKIYNTSAVTDNLAETPEEATSISALTETCVNYMLNNDSSIACISNYMHLNQFFIGKEKILYLSKPFNSYYVQYAIRRECPLWNRIHLFFITVEDLGITKFINRDWFRYNGTFYDRKKNEAQFDEGFRTIKLEDLISFFIVLGIGLSGATISFIIELLLYCLKKNEIRIENSLQ